MLIRRIEDAEVGGLRCDVEIEAGRVAAIRPRPASRPGTGREKREGVLDGRGAALLPGLHDHHVHLLALAARLGSIDCGPPTIGDREALASTLARAEPKEGWIRGTGYHESVAGPLDRDRLDRLRDDVPVRIQHRSGIAWCLNSRAIEHLDLDRDPGDLPPQAIEREAGGRPTGRLFRADDWLRVRLGAAPPPDLAPVGRLLAEAGVTGVTDCSAGNDAEALALLRSAQTRGALPQRLELMGRLSLPEPQATDCVRGPHKIMLDEPALPELGNLVARIEQAHASGRNVAFHTVTRTEIVFAVSALEEAGARPGDRLEHASVAPPEIVDHVARLGLTVVTQPHFIHERGDEYLREVEPRDQPHLYRLASWIDRGVLLGAGSDAPYGSPDPWAAMRAAVERRTRAGHGLGPEEALTPEAACALFAPTLARTRDYDDRRPPTPRVGDPADLCLLDLPWARARHALDRSRVRSTLRLGHTLIPEGDPLSTT